MKILMIGGTGNISTAVSRLLLQGKHELFLYCHENGGVLPENLNGAFVQFGDINDVEGVAAFLKDHIFDVVVDWTVMTPAQAQRDIRLFSGRTSQYVFISSASAYQRSAKNYIITENTPLSNPYWEMSRNKIACENLLTEEAKTQGFPVTIVRPSLTYGDTIIPYVLVNWLKPWSLIDRMLNGKRVVVPGDGTSLWQITHNTDFAKGIVGLMGNRRAIGESFHITSDEVLTWNEVLNQMAEVIGVEPKATHISSEFITAFMPDQIGNLYGDKNMSTIFNNSKLKSVVPDFKATMLFREGFARTYAYLKTHHELQITDTEYEANLDRIIAAHDFGMSMAKNSAGMGDEELL